MNYNDIYLKEYKTIDSFIQKMCIIFGLSFLVVWFLNFIGVFIVSHETMNIALVLTAFIVITPIILFRTIKDKWMYRYIVVSLFTLQIGILYSMITYHVILMFLFPILLIIPYGNNRLKRYTIIISYSNMILSHLASLKFNVLPEDPFQTLYTVLVYNLTPRLIEFTLFLYLLNFLVKRNKSMLNRLFKYSNEVYLTQEEIVKQFAEISESKSGQTGSHVKRVSKYMVVMARELGLDSEEIESLGIASMMHDIGKLMISADIIEKPGKLTKEEFEEIKKHTDFGYKLLENSPGHIMDIAKKIALQHHEKWDGTGYHGIKGADIDYYSRIMSIVDVYDALISKRSYKKAWTTQDAYDEIVSQAGKQFDPQLVKVFEKCFPEIVEISESLPD